LKWEYRGGVGVEVGFRREGLTTDWIDKEDKRKMG